MEKKTCLYDSHVALGAQMSPFGGFIMPIQYSGIVAEHNAVRGSVGVFDVSHMGEIFVSGPDAERFVNHIFTNQISGMEPGKVLYGMMLREDGGTVDDLLVYKEYTADHYLLVVNAANIDKDYAWIESHTAGYDVTVRNESDDWAELAVQGPDAEKTLEKVLGLQLSDLEFYHFKDFERDGKRMIVSRTGYTGEDGFEVYSSADVIVEIWDDLLKAGVVPCGLGCRDTLRFEAGLPLYGHELADDLSPVEAGLTMFAKPENKDEFIGRGALVRRKADGIERKLVGIELDDNAIPRAGYAVLDEEGNEVGTVTTGYHSISLDKSVCMAYVKPSSAALGTRLSVQIRRKVFSGKVVKKRFYTPNYKK